MRKQPEMHGHTAGGIPKLYRVWTTMKTRCFNPNCDAYRSYGGRGITMCYEWIDSYESFRKWSIENGYREGLTIDRKNNDGPYSPENCRWVDYQAQIDNRGRTRLINGKPISYWAKKLGCDPRIIRTRLYILKWDETRAVTQPVR